MDRISEAFETYNQREAAAMRALARAYKEGVHSRLHGIHEHAGRVSAWYGVEIASGYRVQITAEHTFCDCKAGQMDMVCKHVAALCDKAGMFDALVHDFYSRAFPAPVAINLIELARADVVRLARNPKTTADWHTRRAC